MDIEKALLKEHSRKQAQYIANYIGNNAKKLDRLFDFYLSTNTVLCQRATFAYGIVIDNHPQLVVPHLQKMLTHMNKYNVHDAYKRNTVRMLQFVEIPKKLHPQVIETCFKLLLNKSEAIAIRVFSMSTLFQLSKIYPEIANELIPLIEMEMEQGTKPAFISRGKKVLKALQKHKGIKG